MPASEFLKNAKPFHIKIAPNSKNGKTLELEVIPKQFQRGTFGWGVSGKMFNETVAKHELQARVTLNLIVRGSTKQKKDLTDSKEKIKEENSKTTGSENEDEEWSQKEEEEEDESEDDDETEEKDSLSSISIPLPERQPFESLKTKTLEIPKPIEIKAPVINDSSLVKEGNGIQLIQEPVGDQENNWNCNLM